MKEELIKSQGVIQADDSPAHFQIWWYLQGGCPSMTYETYLNTPKYIVACTMNRITDNLKKGVVSVLELMMRKASAAAMGADV